MFYIEEFIRYNSNINGTGGLEKYVLDGKYKDWLKFLEKLKKGPFLKYVKGSTYFLMNGKKIIGMINIRHTLNDTLLIIGGHIGYSIRPTERRKGYVKIMLYLALKKCQKLKLSTVLITCDDDNIASFKTIESLGGILENKIKYKGNLIRRYFIDVNSSLEINKTL